ncbi:hypothetical protein CBS63078_564 [Aspergillus niger]|nr:hypothetical protein CBS63078_564 [Aspergillus niger]
MDSLAVIGYALRYPQDASDSVRFWDFLLKAREASTAFPEDRINQKAFYHPDPDHGGTIHAKRAHFLKDDPARFDAAFFKMSKTEVLSLDPQHRLVMENVYHALENAGIPIETAISSNTSVFVNGYNHDHAESLNTDPETILKYKPTGTENSMISGRLSWFYDFRGPSLTVETACSGSLVGLHLACQSLKTNESDMAIVSGVNVIGFLPHMVGMDYSGFMGSEGRCFAFDHRADGYARSEGVGTVILKRLSSAVTDGDTIRAVIRGTGLNQDGRTPGIAYPSLRSQERLIETTYQNAGLDTADTCYIETHGTGTQAGDYVEASSISSGFKTTTRGLPLYLGALKTSIGHLEGGSGIAGLIKTIMILETGIIPPNANFEKPNPKIPVDEWKLSLPIQCEAWPTSKLRRASVSCFGLSGTNSHCILDDAYNFLRTYKISAKHRTGIGVPTDGDGSPPERVLFSPKSLMPASLSQASVHPVGGSRSFTALFILSGFDKDSLNRVISDLTEYIHMKGRLSSEDERKFLHDLSFTLSQKRSRFNWTVCVLANSISQLQSRLANDSLTPQHARVSPRVGFVFTGQGAQYAGMGLQLLAYPVFRRSIEAAERYFQSLGGEWSLLEELGRDKNSTRINEPTIGHPASTAIQIALFELLASWGIFPTRVVGHSSGEIAAAYCAGKISRQAAWKVAFFRGQVVSSSITRPGSMMAVGLSPDDLHPYLEEVQQSDPNGVLTIACFNSPKNQTVSGDSAMVDALKSLLDAKRIFARKLNLGKAYHSEHMKVFTESYQAYMGSLEQGNTVSRDQPIALFSTFTGDMLLDPSMDPSYWCANMVSPVRFEQALRTLCYSPSEKQTLPNVEHETPLQIDELVEIGSHGALRSAITETIDMAQGITYHSTIDRNVSGPDGILQTVANLVSKGCPVDIPSVNNAEVLHNDSDLLVDLPPYSFNHKNKDIYESRLARNLRLRQYPRHDIFGAPVSDWNPRYPKWRHFLRLSENPWHRQYKLDGQYVFPPVGYIAMAIESVMQVNSGEMTMKGLHLERITLGPLLALRDEAQGVEISLSHYPVGDGSELTRFQVSSYNESQENWTEHCSGYFSIEYDGEGMVHSGLADTHKVEGLKEDLSYQRHGCQRHVKFDDMCRSLSSSGLELGPIFQNLSSMRVSGERTGRCIGTIQVPDVSSVMPKNYMHPHLLHPVTLNYFGIVATAAIHDLQPHNTAMKTYLPSFIEHVWVSTEVSYDLQTKFNCLGTATTTGLGKYSCDIEASIGSSSAGPTISFSGAHFDLYESEIQSSKTDLLPKFYSVEWKPDIHLLTNSFFGQLTKPPTIESARYEVECQWFTDLQLASALLSTDALLSLRGADLTQLEPHYLRFYDLLKHIAADILTDSMPRVPFKTWQKYAQNHHLKEQLYRRVEARDSDGALLMRVGSNLASFFRKEADPLHVMFGQDDLMSQYYKHDFEIGSISEKLALYLDLFRWYKSNLRVLEVGGGTGSFTAHALANLCPPGIDRSVSEYVFTDLSPSFFAKAKESLNEWDDIMTFKKFDVGNDPISQGFDPGTFDLIVASNVLHATPDLHGTLKNIHSLLKPGGKLVFHEGVRQDTLWTNISFSPLSGWWLSTEPERRWCPYVPTSTWDRYLRETGFSGLDLEFPSSDYSEFSKISLMVSTAREETNISPRETSGVIIIIADDQSATLAHEFQGQIGYLEPHCSIHTLAEVEAVDVLDRTCVLFMVFSPPIPTDSNIESYNKLEKVLSKGKKILFVTGDSTDNPAFDIPIGLIRNKRMQQDSDNSNLVTVSLTDTEMIWNTISEPLVRVFKHQFLSGTVPTIRNAEYRLAQGVILTNRVALNADANSTIGGRLSTPRSVPLTWGDIDRPIKLTCHGRFVWETDNLLSDTLLGETEVDLDVKAIGLGSRDVLAATGSLPQMTLGEEASGVVTKVGSSVKDLQSGDRVMCIGDTQAGREGTLRTGIRINSSLVTRIPDSLTFEAAAGLPVSWLAAIYSISYAGRLVTGENILIHSAASSIGQAAIQYAQSLGAKVFVTVSNVDDKHYVARKYGVQRDCIFSSRPTSFPAQIKRRIPRGMDVIISDLSAGTTQGSVSCLAPFGRLIAISNDGLQSVQNISASCNTDNITISKVNLSSIARSRPATIQNIFRETMQLMEEHKIRFEPPRRVLTYSQLHRGIEMLQKDAIAGKIVLHPSEDAVEVVPGIPRPSQLEHNASYLLIGASDSLHCKLALRMADRGAKNLILLSRARGLDTGDTQQQILNTLREQGCEAHIYHCNMSEASELQSLIARWRSQLPPINGIVKSTYCMGPSNQPVATRPTSSPNDIVMELLNLHNAIPSVEFFIMISPISGLTGRDNDSDFSPASAFQDALVRHRLSRGMHGASVHVRGMKDEEVLAAVDYMTDIRNPPTVDSCQMVCNVPTPASYEEVEKPVARYLSAPLFHQLPSFRSRVASMPTESARRPSVADLLNKTNNTEQAAAVVSREIRQKLSHLLNVTEDEINELHDVRTNGVDSLIEMEFRNWLDRELGTTISLEDLTSKSILKLSAYVVTASPLVSFT